MKKNKLKLRSVISRNMKKQQKCSILKRRLFNMARKSRKNDTLNEITVSKSNFTINTAFYIRLSVEDNKNRGNSIEHQQMLLRNFIAVNPEFQVVKTYIDNGKTGTNFVEVR